MSLKEIDLKELSINPFHMFNNEWGLLTAGDRDKHNAMTIGWGTLGMLWAKPVCIVYVRPQRYTKQFMDEAGDFTVSFFPEAYRNALQLLGTKSGRDGDKIAESGLTPHFTGDAVAFEEAHTVFVCKKLYGGIELGGAQFVDTALRNRVYPEKDYHYMYVGRIDQVLVNK